MFNYKAANQHCTYSLLCSVKKRNTIFIVYNKNSVHFEYLPWGLNVFTYVGFPRSLSCNSTCRARLLVPSPALVGSVYLQKSWIHGRVIQNLENSTKHKARSLRLKPICTPNFYFNTTTWEDQVWVSLVQKFLLENHEFLTVENIFHNFTFKQRCLPVSTIRFEWFVLLWILTWISQRSPNKKFYSLLMTSASVLVSERSNGNQSPLAYLLQSATKQKVLSLLTWSSSK